MELPLPPQSLIRRVGVTGEDLEANYLRVGAFERDVVVQRLPEDWNWAERRILDFGCGAGGALRHFGSELEAGAELWGCDIDGPSVEWADRHMSRVHFFQNGEEPPLDVPDGHFDLIYAMSVFTHITDHWADWLIELRRVLRPGGLLIASILGEAMYEKLGDGTYEEDAVGMTITGLGLPWDTGGPVVFHSPWWIERHWTQAFEIASYERNVRSSEGAFGGHDLVVGCRASADPDRAAMLTPCPDEPREATAALANVRLLSKELVFVRTQLRRESA